MDLFENIDVLPENVRAVCSKYIEDYANNGLDYKGCKQFLSELEPLGYRFEYGLDAVPYNLHIIQEFMDVLTIEDFDDVVTDMDGNKWSQMCCGHAEQMVEEGTEHNIDATQGSGICGVKGCDVESEHYVDFKNK